MPTTVVNGFPWGTITTVGADRWGNETTIPWENYYLMEWFWNGTSTTSKALNISGQIQPGQTRIEFTGENLGFREFIAETESQYSEIHIMLY